MWHKPCRTFHPWCLSIKTRCLFTFVCNLAFTDELLCVRFHYVERNDCVIKKFICTFANVKLFKIRCHNWYAIQHQNRNVIILTKFSSLAASEVVILTTSDTARWWKFHENDDISILLMKKKLCIYPCHSGLYHRHWGNLQIYGFVQEKHNSIANALELRLSCTNPSNWYVSLTHTYVCFPRSSIIHIPDPDLTQHSTPI